MSKPANQANRIIGALLGLALGDAFGAPFEGGVLERILWRFIGIREGKRRWTDDTQMTFDLVESLIQCRKVDQGDLANRFAKSYRWSRGYGPGTARVLRRIRRGEPWKLASHAVYVNGSYGNGGAMRSPAIGLFFGNHGADAVAEAAEAAAIITHAHPLAREGAVQIALATALALEGADQQQILTQLSERAMSQEFSEKVAIAKTWLVAGQDIVPSQVAVRLGRGIAAAESCTTAVYVAMRFLEDTFEDLLGFTIKIGGDVDTIAAMAGAIWGATRGADELPQEMLAKLENHDRLLSLATHFSEIVEYSVRPTTLCT